MLNEERVRLMTQAATCYQQQEKEAMRINEFYKKDYVSYNVIKSGFAFTVAYLIVAVMAALYSVEWFMEHEGRVLVVCLVLAAVFYFITAFLFITLSRRIYTNKYNKAREDIKKYHQILVSLNHIYAVEEASVQETKKEGGL